MIDSKTGCLQLGKEQIVKPHTDLHTVELMNLGEVQKYRGIGNDWSWYDVKNLEIEGNYYNISFLFQHQVINSITFFFQNKPFNLNEQWESWSEEIERNNEQRFNDWLDVVLDKERNFDWGSVSSIYNPKSGFSSITIKYT